MTTSSKQSSELILQVSNLGKVYARNIGDVRKRLGRAAWRALLCLGREQIKKLRASEFWAVQDVNLELHRGEAVGIIGLNGSGKTTLLRLLAGQIQPDKGQILISGTTAAMIDLQAGFQAQASGRENIFLRAAALGFTRAETQAHLTEIIEFSELDAAIDAPMSTYSAGMRMRLAFSVMATVSPDILFIDEVLAVGDFRFRQKCLAKVRKMRERSAFVFVSHSMNDVAQFCDRVIVMHQGCAHFEGPPDEAIAFYESLEESSSIPSVDQKLAAAMGPVFENESAIGHVEHYWCDSNGNQKEQMPFNEPINLRIKFEANIDVRNLIIGVPVWALNSHYTTGLSTQIGSHRFNVQRGDAVELELQIEGAYFNPGTLKSMLTILDGPEFLYRRENPDLQIQSAPHPTWGAVSVPHRWERLDLHKARSPSLKAVRRS